MKNESKIKSLKSKNKNILSLKEVSAIIKKIIDDENTENYKIICEKIEIKYDIRKENLNKIKRRVYDILNVLKSIKNDCDFNEDIQKLTKK